MNFQFNTIGRCALAFAVAALVFQASTSSSFAQRGGKGGGKGGGGGAMRGGGPRGGSSFSRGPSAGGRSPAGGYRGSGSISRSNGSAYRNPIGGQSPRGGNYSSSRYGGGSINRGGSINSYNRSYSSANRNRSSAYRYPSSQFNRGLSTFSLYLGGVGGAGLYNRYGYGVGGFGPGLIDGGFGYGTGYGYGYQPRYISGYESGYGAYYSPAPNYQPSYGYSQYSSGYAPAYDRPNVATGSVAGSLPTTVANDLTPAPIEVPSTEPLVVVNPMASVLESDVPAVADPYSEVELGEEAIDLSGLMQVEETGEMPVLDGNFAPGTVLPDGSTVISIDE